MRRQQREERDVPRRVHGGPRGQAASARREAEEQHDVGDVREQERGQPDDEPQVAGDVQQRVPAPREADRDEQQHRHGTAQGPSRQEHGEREGRHEEQLRRARRVVEARDQHRHVQHRDDDVRREGEQGAPAVARRGQGCSHVVVPLGGGLARGRHQIVPSGCPVRGIVPRSRPRASTPDMPKAGGLAPTGLRIGCGELS